MLKKAKDAEVRLQKILETQEKEQKLQETTARKKAPEKKSTGSGRTTRKTQK